VSGTGKIDPLMATFSAVSLMALNPEARGNVNGFYSNPIMVGL
jgi:phage terminase large subunit-like protein